MIIITHKTTIDPSSEHGTVMGELHIESKDSDISPNLKALELFLAGIIDMAYRDSIPGAVQAASGVSTALKLLDMENMSQENQVLMSLIFSIIRPVIDNFKQSMEQSKEFNDLMREKFQQDDLPSLDFDEINETLNKKEGDDDGIEEE